MILHGSPPKKTIVALALALLSAAATAQATFYVSPSGSDANNGTSTATPFQTLEKAQAALQASPTKTVYLLGGTYGRTATLSLTAADAGESWLGYPGQTPILDGGNSTVNAISILANNVTVRWLTIRNFVQNAIAVPSGWAASVTGDVIDSNSILNTRSTGWNQAAIVVQGTLINGQITHNYIQGAQYAGIGAYVGANNEITGLTISENSIYNTCQGINDCGAIYANDQGFLSSNIMIDHFCPGKNDRESFVSCRMKLLGPHSTTEDSPWHIITLSCISSFRCCQDINSINSSKTLTATITSKTFRLGANSPRSSTRKPVASKACATSKTASSPKVAAFITSACPPRLPSPRFPMPIPSVTAAFTSSFFTRYSTAVAT